MTRFPSRRTVGLIAFSICDLLLYCHTELTIETVGNRAVLQHPIGVRITFTLSTLLNRFRPPFALKSTVWLYTLTCNKRLLSLSPFARQECHNNGECRGQAA